MSKKTKAQMAVITQLFAEQTKMEKKTADRVLKIIYDKGLDAKQFDRVLWRMRSLVMNTKVQELINSMPNTEIEGLVDEIVIQDQERSQEVCCSETEELHFRAFFADLPHAEKGKEFKAGDVVDIQIMRTGKWNHPIYGRIDIGASTLSEVKQHFDKNTRKIKLAVDENHEQNHKALGWFKELYQKGKDSLFAKIELTKKGAELLTEWAYKYFSPEIMFQKKDEETGSVVRNLLIGGAFTNRPFFKAMSPLLASEDVGDVAANRHQQGTTGNESSVLLFNSSNPMLKLLEKLTQLGSRKSITKDERDDLQACFNETSQDDLSDEIKTAFNETIALFNEDDGGEGEDKGGDEKGAEGAGDDAGAEGEGDGAGEGEWDGADAWEGEGDGSESDAGADAGVAASEKGKKPAGFVDKDVTIKASELDSYKKAAADAAKIVREARKNQTLAKANGMVFSETNKKGVVLKKNVQEIVDFAMTLSEKGAAKFFSIIEKMRTVDAGEAGHGGNAAAGAGEGAKFSEKDEEKISYFMEKLGQTRDEAIESFKEFQKSESSK